MQRIENDFLTVDVNENGAELWSIKSKKTGTEYLWQGNAEYWKGRAPILFPICGRLFEGKYFYEGKEYAMPIHGIAKLFCFECKKSSESEIVLTLTSNEKTKEYYPFDFEFSVNYSLNSATLTTSFDVKNTGDQGMYFSYGGHPGFNVPFSQGESFEDYYLEFTKKELNRLVFSETCFLTDKVEQFKLNKQRLSLQHSMFDNDALFFETEKDKVRLKSESSKNSIEVSYNDMTCVGIWHKPKTDAPYICIEPWHGVPSTDGVVDQLKQKQQMICLPKKKRYINSYNIKIIEE